MSGPSASGFFWTDGGGDLPGGSGVHPLVKRLFRILSILLVLGGPVEATGSENGGSGQTASSAEAQCSGVNPAMWFVSFYRAHISAVDGDRCPSLPSCASYSVNALKKHGFFLGWMMTVDRLIHEGREEVVVSPTVLSEGKWKIYDPVENNDFWWYHPGREYHE